VEANIVMKYRIVCVFILSSILAPSVFGSGQELGVYPRQIWRAQQSESPSQSGLSVRQWL
jgi:hypothetical protein